MRNQIGSIIRDAAIGIAILLLSTLVGFLFRQCGFQESNVIVVYIFSVLLIARFTSGYIFGITASIIAMLLFNWFYTEPYYTLKVYDVTYFITFAIMAVTAVMTSTLTSKAKQAAIRATEREMESNALYQMTNMLTKAEDSDAVARILITVIGEVLCCNTSCVCFDDCGVPEKTLIQRREDGTVVRRELDGVQEKISQHTDTADISSQECLYPIKGANTTLAVLRIPRQNASAMTKSQTRMLHSIMESASLALERQRSLREQIRSREETTQERFRANLLRAISHDLRTPLAGIMGTSEMLMDTTQPDDRRYSLAEDIYIDAQWLHNMVENILGLTRLQDGRLAINKQTEVIEEVIGAAVMLMERRLRGREIDVEMPEEVLMAPMDARLINQVLVNLLDNAAKHTPTDRQIKVSAFAESGNVCITVADRGSGIRDEDLPNIFKMFYTTSSGSSDSRRGVGLGLAICQSIVEAHGGKIWAENQKEGGAAFTFTLPVR